MLISLYIHISELSVPHIKFPLFLGRKLRCLQCWELDLQVKVTWTASNIPVTSVFFLPQKIQSCYIVDMFFKCVFVDDIQDDPTKKRNQALF